MGSERKKDERHEGGAVQTADRRLSLFENSIRKRHFLGAQSDFLKTFSSWFCRLQAAKEPIGNHCGLWTVTELLHDCFYLVFLFLVFRKSATFQFVGRFLALFRHQLTNACHEFLL